MIIVTNKTREKIGSHLRGFMLRPGTNELNEKKLHARERAMLDALEKSGVVSIGEPPPESGKIAIAPDPEPSQSALAPELGEYEVEDLPVAVVVARRPPMKKRRKKSVAK
jgi:hypothetical protein